MTREFSMEHRANLSASHTGLHHSKETKAQMSASHKEIPSSRTGMHHSEKTKAMLSAIMTTPEMKARLQASWNRISKYELRLVNALALNNAKLTQQMFVRYGRTWTWIDVAFPEVKLAIYIDGHRHTYEYYRVRDSRIDTALETNGWTALRFTNEQISRDLTVCVESIVASVESLLCTQQQIIGLI